MLVTVKQIKTLLIPRLIHYINNKNSDDEITVEELLTILNGTFTPFAVDDEITDADIQKVLNQTYSPVDDEFSNTDFIFN